MGDSNAITVAGRGRAGIAERPVREGIEGSKKSVALPELSTRLLGGRSCEMQGFLVRTSDLESSRLLRDDVDTLLECVMRCRVLGEAIDDDDVDEVRERVVGKVTLEVVDLRFGFVAVCA
jgi:hypothetical protein